jgi:hypothetical protein
MSSGEEEKVNQWARVVKGAGEKVAIWLQAELLMWPETNGVARDRLEVKRKLASTTARGLCGANQFELLWSVRFAGSTSLKWG